MRILLQLFFIWGCVGASKVCFQGPETECICERGEMSCRGIIPVPKENVRVLKATSLSLPILSQHILDPFKGLEGLALTNCGIEQIEKDAFKTQASSLRWLDLSHNKLTSLPDLSKYFLTNLSVSGNHLDRFPESLPPSLEQLDLSSNNLTMMKTAGPLARLKHLSLSGNALTKLHTSSLWGMNGLEWLDLSSNEIHQIPGILFSTMKSLRFVSLADNKLKTLEAHTFAQNTQLHKVNLTGNLWSCDERLLPLTEWLRVHEAYREGALCHHPPGGDTLQHALEVLQLQTRMRDSPLCDTCDCSISRDKLIVTVDCSGRQLTRLPESVPYKTKVLNLTSNRIQSLSVEHINKSLWSDVSFLYLNHNNIDSSKGLEGNWLLRNLVALHLSHNALHEVPIHILEQIRGGLLDELYLAGNPWTCDCNTVLFQTWLQDNYRVVRNFDGIACAQDSPYAGQPIHKLKKSQLCPQSVQLVNYLDVVNVLMGVAIIIIIFKLAYDFVLQRRTGKLPRFFSLNLQ